jgi:hypothetical protein
MPFRGASETGVASEPSPSPPATTNGGPARVWALVPQDHGETCINISAPRSRLAMGEAPPARPSSITTNVALSEVAQQEVSELLAEGRLSDYYGWAASAMTGGGVRRVARAGASRGSRESGNECDPPVPRRSRRRTPTPREHGWMAPGPSTCAAHREVLRKIRGKMIRRPAPMISELASDLHLRGGRYKD